MSRLRSTIERRISVKDDEVRLSKDARRVIFRGSYAWPGQVTEVSAQKNYRESSQDSYPHKVKIVRTHSDGTKSISGTGPDSPSWNDKVLPTITELTNPQALNRATRVEKIARRVKVTASLLTVTGLIAFGAYNKATDDNGDKHPTGGTKPPAAGAKSPHEGVDDCVKIVTGDETLMAITDAQTEALQKTGARVCELAGHSYLVQRQEPAGS